MARPETKFVFIDPIGGRITNGEPRLVAMVMRRREVNQYLINRICELLPDAHRPLIPPEYANVPTPSIPYTEEKKSTQNPDTAASDDDESMDDNDDDDATVLEEVD